MATWPAAPFPQLPLRRGFLEEWHDNRVRTQMDVGEPKQRPRSTKSIDRLTVSFKVTTPERATLKTFVRTTLAQGSLPFDWVHPIEQTTQSFGFVTMPKFTPRTPTTWTASFQLEIR